MPLKVMPIMEFAGDFSWGYNPSHPFAIASIYDRLRQSGIDEELFDVISGFEALSVEEK